MNSDEHEKDSSYFFAAHDRESQKTIEEEKRVNVSVGDEREIEKNIEAENGNKQIARGRRRAHGKEQKLGITCGQTRIMNTLKGAVMYNMS